MSDEAGWRALGELAVSKGQMTPAQLEAGLASDAAPPTEQAPEPNTGGRDALGRFAGKPEPREVQVMRAVTDEMVRHGRLTREKADQMLAADLHSLKVAGEFAADGANPTPQEAAALDQYLSNHEATEAARMPKAADPLGKHELDPAFDRPADPTEYVLPASGLDVPTVRAIQELSWQTRLPQPIFSEVFSIGTGYMQRTVSDNEFELLTRRTRAQLTERYGDETSTKLEQAQRVITTLMKQKPALEDALLKLMGSGLGSDYRFCVQMCEHAARLYGKK